MRTIQCRSFCSVTQQTDPIIFQLEGRSSSGSSERNGTRVGSTNPICIFPIHSDWHNAAENEAGSSVGSMFDHTTVESTAVVSFGTGNVHRFPSADSDGGRYVNGPDQNPHLLVRSGHIQLVTLRVSGILLKAKEFQRRLQASFSHRGGKEQRQVTLLHGTSGTAGVIKGIMIPFQHL